MKTVVVGPRPPELDAVIATGRLLLFVLDGDRYREADHSRLLDVDVAQLAGDVRWPT